MIDPRTFADRQLELAAEFAQHIADHPEIDEALPAQSHICFQIDGELDFNRYGRELAERRRQDGTPIVVIRAKGLAPRSRLIDPMIESDAAVA
jgi:hypothetical protein